MQEKPGSSKRGESVYLLAIAKALSDGVPVDWEDSDEDGPETRLMKARLRFLQSVVEAHRRVLKEKEVG